MGWTEWAKIEPRNSYRNNSLHDFGVKQADGGRNVAKAIIGLHKLQRQLSSMENPDSSSNIL